MKKILAVILCSTISVFAMSQGNSGNKGKQKDKLPVEKHENDKAEKVNKDKANDNKAKENDHDNKVWDGIGDASCMKPSKNQPAKVRAAFQRDYPNAINARWTKCRGDWTATFNGSIFRSTAVYHANGERKDTRTPVTRESIPRKVLDEIFKRRPATRLDEAIKIEVPNAVKEIFRVKNLIDGKPSFEFFNSDGVLVNYSY